MSLNRPSLAVLLVAMVSLSGLLQAPAQGQNLEFLDDLNPLLGPEFAQWMVGPLGQISSSEERESYLSLSSDDEAREFIENFWRQPEHQLIAGLYRERSEEADRRFTESQVAGRRTDRGTIFILYGEPNEVTFEEFRDIEDPPVELWRYSPKEAGPGLDGRKPAKTYRFVRIGDLTRSFVKGGPGDPEEQRRRDPRLRPPFRGNGN